MSVEDKLKLIDKRKRLQARIDTFVSRGETILEGDEDELANEGAHPNIRNWYDEEVDEDSDDEDAGDPESSAVPPEMQTLPLPSARVITPESSPLLRTLAEHELQLQMGHANDALHKLRIAIGHKSFFFRKNVRTARNYDARTRAYSSVRSLDIAVSHHADVYQACRQSMVALGANRGTLNKYKELEREHLRADTAVINPNERGHRNDRMAWIWAMHDPATQESPDWLRECR